MKSVVAWYQLQPNWIKTAILSVFALLLAVASIIAAIAHELSPRSMCGSRKSYTTVSPDGAYRAVLYEFDCGATSDFGTHLALQSNKGKFDPFDANEDSLIFSADTNHGNASVDGYGILNMDLRWVDSSHLMVYVPAGARVFTKKSTSGPISILYETAHP